MENGDRVVATVRKKCPELEALKEKYKDNLEILTMDIGSSESVELAKKELEKKLEHLDLIVNNAVTVSPDCDKQFFDVNLANTFKDDNQINIFCVHPGWIRTDGKEDNPAPLSSYEAAEILRKLFEEKRYDLTGPRFITNGGNEYPF